jgi:molecular chaperone DnaJ
MAQQRDFYEILGVERTATTSQISESYRKLAIRFHPDKNPGNDEASDRFKEAARAFEVLSDEQLRARYDRYGHAGLQGAGRTSSTTSPTSSRLSATSSAAGCSAAIPGGGRTGRGRGATSSVRCR